MSKDVRLLRLYITMAWTGKRLPLPLTLPLIFICTRRDQTLTH